MNTGSIGSAANLLSFFQASGSSAQAARAPARGHHHHVGAPQSSPTSDDSSATLHYQRTERTGLSIVTQEGDVVRLRIKVSDSVDAAAANGTADSTQVAQLAVDARSSVKISFHVDGNLNADELAAIQDVVQQVGALADKFFAGDVPAAFAAAQNLNIDSSQLAKVGLRLSANESVTYSGPALAPPATSAPAPTPEPTAQPPTAGDVAPPVAAEPVTTAQDTSSTTDTSVADAAAPTPPASDPVPAPASPAPPSVAGNALAAIGDFLHQLLGTLGTQPDGGSQASLSVSLKLRIFAATVAHISVASSSPATDGSGSNAQPLLGDTLDALAAAHDPPLSATA